MRPTQDCYDVAAALPEYEKYGLASQIRRSAVSVPSNVVEGAGRGSEKDFARFVGIALTSAKELETQLRLAEDHGLVRGIEIRRARGEALGVRRMLELLYDSLRRRTR
jgi:four helix bundle protein